MSVTTITNRATNPSVAVAATNWSAVAGTGGAATGGRVATVGPDGLAGCYRVDWTTQTSDTTSGGVRYTQTGLSAATQYTHSMWVYCNKQQYIALHAQYQNSSAANVNSVVGAVVDVPPNTWKRIYVTATSGAAVDRVQLTAQPTAPNGNAWAAGDWMLGDQVFISTGATLHDYSDGGYTDGLGWVYNWTGASNASTSTAVLYDPELTAVAKVDSPCARVDLTITDLAPELHHVTIWRIADGKRKRVRSFEEIEVVGSDFTTDYEPPLNRVVTYEIEVLDGVGYDGPGASSTVSVQTPDGCGYIQDPLNPESAIKVYAEAGPNGEPTLLPSALAKLNYHMDGELVNILGSSEPVALLGQRMAASNIPFDMFTDTAQQSTDLRNLLLTAPLLLIRPGADWGNSLPGLCYVAPPDPEELPIGVTFGAEYTEWRFTASLVAAPEMAIVIPLWTYGDWSAIWTTYSQAQSTLSGKTYLAVRRSPTNGL